MRRVAAGELPRHGPHPPPRPRGRLRAPGRQLARLPGRPRAAIEHGFAPVERLAGRPRRRLPRGHRRVRARLPGPRAAEAHLRALRGGRRAGSAVRSRRSASPTRGSERYPASTAPGAYSVNARGPGSSPGIGQRMITGAAHVGGVLVASGEDEIRGVLVPVYEALGLEWSPETTGSVAGELGRAVDPVELIDALVAELADDARDRGGRRRRRDAGARRAPARRRLTASVASGLMADCSHLDQVTVDAKASYDACEDCVREGTQWLAPARLPQLRARRLLRLLADEARLQARRGESSHAIVSSAEPGEAWSWCYVDEVMLDLEAGHEH